MPDLPDTRRLCVVSQSCSASSSGRARIWRASHLTGGGAPRTAASTAYRAPMRVSASLAMGESCARTRSKNLRRTCAQQPASCIRPPAYSASKPAKASACTMPLNSRKCSCGCAPPAVRRVGEPHRGRSRAGGRPVVAHIHPQPPGARASPTRSKHRQGRIVGVDPLACSHVARQRLHQRSEQIRRGAHPVGQGGALQPHTLARVNGALPVQRQVVAVLGGEHVGEQPGGRAARP